jgi:purine catabolism regulator
VSHGDYLSVGELVTETGLELYLLTGDVGLERRVQGIHLADYDDPTPWMATGTVLITTGAPFADSAVKGVRFLDRIAEKDTVALGVGTGHHLDHVPPEMVDHARRLRVAVFEIPPSVPFRTIFGYVYNALASSDMHRLRRTLAVQGQLLDLLIEEKGIGEVLSRLARILEMQVVLFDDRGTVVARAGSKPPDEKTIKRIWEAYESTEDLGPLGILEFEHGRFHIRRVLVHDAVERVLAAVAEQPAASSELSELALSYAQRLIALDLQRQREQHSLRRRMRAILLDDLLSHEEVDRDLAERLLDQGIDLGRTWRVVVCCVDRVTPLTDEEPLGERESYRLKTELQVTAESFLTRRHLPCISMVKGEAVVALCDFEGLESPAAPDTLVELRQALADRLPELVVSVGASSAARGQLGPAAAFRQAREAVRAAGQGIAVLQRVVLFEMAGGRFRLLKGQSDESLRSLCERLVVPLVEYDRRHHTSLLPTLRAFFDSRLSVHQTADALYVHRNTLGKRLHRIEELLGVDLAQIDDVFELYLALRAAELLESVNTL